MKINIPKKIQKYIIIYIILLLALYLVIEIVPRVTNIFETTQILEPGEVQLTCDALGYLPTRRAVRGGGYSGMIFNGQCGPEGGDALVRESLALIRESGVQTVC